MIADRFESVLAHTLTAAAAVAVLFVAGHSALAGHGARPDLLAQAQPGAVSAKKVPERPMTRLAGLTAVRPAKG